MTRHIVVTGTDTGVGKTIATAAIAATLMSRGVSVVVVKPVQTGVGPGEPGDADEVGRLSGAQVCELARVAPALAPESAARLDGTSLPTIDEHAEQIRAFDHDVVIVEGAGGILVRLDLEGGTILDLAELLRAEVVVVTRESLGTLNHTGLTVDRVRSAGLEPVLVIGSAAGDPALEAHSNHDDLLRLTGCRVAGRIPARAGALPPAEFRRDAPGWFAAS